MKKTLYMLCNRHHEKAEGFCGDPMAVTSEMPVASEMPITSKMFIFLDDRTSLRWLAMMKTIGFCLSKSRTGV